MISYITIDIIANRISIIRKDDLITQNSTISFMQSENISFMQPENISFIIAYINYFYPDCSNEDIIKLDENDPLIIATNYWTKNIYDKKINRELYAAFKMVYYSKPTEPIEKFIMCYELASLEHNDHQKEKGILYQNRLFHSFHIRENLEGIIRDGSG